MDRTQTSVELASFPQACIAAYAARCALRVVPVLGRSGKFREMWQERAAERAEMVVRSVQAVLAACTTRTRISAPLADVVVFTDAAARTAAFAAHAAFAGATPKAATFASFAADAAANPANWMGPGPGDYAAARIAAHDDLSHLDQIKSEVGTDGPVPIEFFRRPLWLDGTPAKFTADMLPRFQAALRDVNLGWAAEAFPRWMRGDFDPEAMARDVNAWAERQPRPADSPPMPEMEQVAPAPKADRPVWPTEDTRDMVRPFKPDFPKESPPKQSQTPPAPPPPPPPPERGVESRLGNDGTSVGDALNRTRLAQVLAEFLRDERTQTPLTLSIEGRWGSGKTRFMKLLQAEIDPPKGEPEPKRRLRTIWFNPWRHQSNEELWAAFALTVLEEARRFLPWPRRVAADMRLGWACLDQRRFWRSAAAVFAKVAAAVALVVVFAAFAEAGWKPADLLEKMQTGEFWLHFIGVPLAVSAPVIAIAQAALWVWKGMGGYLRHELEIHLDRPNYAARTSFLAEFHRDFARAMRVYSGGRPLVVFIDDLDRCDVPRAAELMQGINLMLGEDAPLIYVLGIDRAKVAAGIAVKHRDLLPFLYARELAGATKDQEAQELRSRGIEYGYEFIEKFIQLPFRLPPSEHEELRSFIRSRLTQPEKDATAKGAQTTAKAEAKAGRAEPEGSSPATGNVAPPAGGNAGAPPTNLTGSGQSALAPAQAPAAVAAPPAEVIFGDETHLEEPLLHAARVLDGNPRRIAQLVNLVRLQRRLAPALRVKVRDGQLAKWTAVALRWPVFLVELERSPGLLTDLVKTTDPDPRTTQYDRWNAVRELVACLRDRGPGGKHSDYDLTEAGAVQGLLRLGVAVPVAEVAAAVTGVASLSAAAPVITATGTVTPPEQVHASPQ